MRLLTPEPSVDAGGHARSRVLAPGPVLQHSFPARTAHAPTVAAQRNAQRPHTGWAAVERLSRRELEVASLVAEGATNRDIAERLWLSVRTVESHMARIFDKLALSSRASVAAATAVSGCSESPLTVARDSGRWQDAAAIYRPLLCRL